MEARTARRLRLLFVPEVSAVVAMPGGPERPRISCEPGCASTVSRAVSTFTRFDLFKIPLTFVRGSFYYREYASSLDRQRNSTLFLLDPVDQSIFRTN